MAASCCGQRLGSLLRSHWVAGAAKSPEESLAAASPRKQRRADVERERDRLAAQVEYLQNLVDKLHALLAQQGGHTPQRVLLKED